MSIAGQALMTTVRDLLTPLVPEPDLHRHFARLMGTKGHAPAQELLREVFGRLPRPDGNFVRDFQTTGFDARIWELYVYAVGLFNGFTVLRPEDSPYFLFERDGLRAWIECVTANPSTTRPPAIPVPGSGDEAVCATTRTRYRSGSEAPSIPSSGQCHRTGTFPTSPVNRSFSQSLTSAIQVGSARTRSDCPLSLRPGCSRDFSTWTAAGNRLPAFRGTRRLEDHPCRLFQPAWRRTRERSVLQLRRNAS